MGWERPGLVFPLPLWGVPGVLLKLPACPSLGSGPPGPPGPPQSLQPCPVTALPKHPWAVPRGAVWALGSARGKLLSSGPFFPSPLLPSVSAGPCGRQLRQRPALGRGGRAGVGAPARPFPSAGPPRGLGQLKPQEEEARNQELAGAVWGLSVSRSSAAQEQLPTPVMPVPRPGRRRPAREAVGQGPGRRSERGTRDRVEQGRREGRDWGWGWGGGRLGCLQGQPWPC